MAEYNTYTADPGEHVEVHIGNRGTIENVLYDVTADGALITFYAQSESWTLRNVGVRGQSASDTAIIGAAETSGGTARIENVYLGDGTPGSIDRSGPGLWVAPDHSGHLIVDGVNIQEMGDGAFHCSAPGYNGSGGTVEIRNCYAANSWVAQYRMGEGSLINSTAQCDSRRDDGRGLWAWPPGPTEVRDCHFAMNGRHYSFRAGANDQPGYIDVYDTQYDTGFNGGALEATGDITFHSGNGTSPSNIVPDGCPTSPEMAASGETSDPSDPDGGDDSPMFSPLTPVDPSPWENTMVVRRCGDRNNTGEGGALVRVWLETTNTDDATITDDYDANPYEAVGITNDGDNGNRVLLSCTVGGGEEYRRFAFRFDATVHDYEIAEPGGSLELDDAQIELNGEILHEYDGNWEYRPPTSDYSVFPPLYEADPHPYDHTGVIRRCGDRENEGGSGAAVTVWIDSQDADDIEGTQDYNAHSPTEGASFGYDEDRGLAYFDCVVGGGEDFRRYAFRCNAPIVDYEIYRHDGAPADWTVDDVQIEFDGDVHHAYDGDFYYTEFDHVLMITGETTYPPETSYEIVTEPEGTAIHTDESDATIDDEDEIWQARDGSWWWTGRTANWRDGIRFDGELLGVEVDGPANLYIDGNAVDPADYNYTEQNRDHNTDDGVDDGTGDDGDDGDDGSDTPSYSDPPAEMRVNGAVWYRHDFALDN